MDEFDVDGDGCDGGAGWAVETKLVGCCCCVVCGNSMLFICHSVRAVILGFFGIGVISGISGNFSASAVASRSPRTSANPRIFNISATRSNGAICSCRTFISPLYINSTTAVNSVHLTSRIMTIGCWHGLSKNKLWKYGLHADKTILWALIELPSHASVTSTNDSLCSNWSKTFVKFDW